MDNQTKQPRAVTYFYQSLDPAVAAGLSAAQKRALEDAVIAMTLSSRHRIDIRHGFPFFRARFYFVFLFGRDLRRRPRAHPRWYDALVTLLIVIGLLFCTASVLLTLYMIKSALHIDIFKDYHLGVWDWFMSLYGNPPQR
ncbi:MULTISPECIES: hypothetical protein [Edwardsiella]|uniref:Inner membrane protein n=1 Tax=Edwardsiella anguillarum TaxID=1821960 RepID=A0ABY8SC86_9GAMM|nr:MULTISPECIES: hypothetical protein [Edwardsiella]AKR77928.1 hypothetical protein AAZ33_09970 [Edwardsiella sp. LADL05-105]MDA6077577.1 hypothetical protein [Edwardsiella anguillarum]UOU77625.1 hypothetical protein MUN71_11170 [Edwardsiella anguillarum]WHP82263.1 hypothetical protein MQ095_10630 [Edwardsiella anguillarum]WHP86063.1 hypothetical protein MQ088_10640 [Edwardsiella anguillarum]